MLLFRFKLLPCLRVLKFQPIQLTDFHEILYGRYVIRGLPNVLLYTFLQSVIGFEKMQVFKGNSFVKYKTRQWPHETYRRFYIFGFIAITNKA
jgi:hypothetical protein